MSDLPTTREEWLRAGITEKDLEAAMGNREEFKRTMRDQDPASRESHSIEEVLPSDDPAAAEEPEPEPHGMPVEEPSKE